MLSHHYLCFEVSIICIAGSIFDSKIIITLIYISIKINDILYGKLFINFNKKEDPKPIFNIFFYSIRALDS